MPVNALFLAMDNFFRQFVNFYEQSLVRKVAVANFCDHSGASDCSAVTVAPLFHRILTSQSKRGLDYNSIPMGRTLIAQPQECA